MVYYFAAYVISLLKYLSSMQASKLFDTVFRQSDVFCNQVGQNQPLCDDVDWCMELEFLLSKVLVLLCSKFQVILIPLFSLIHYHNWTMRGGDAWIYLIHAYIAYITSIMQDNLEVITYNQTKWDRISFRIQGEEP